ncbi:MAG: hypothetical protein ABJA02_09130, partial [Acidobacteriota bacterium]
MKRSLIALFVLIMLACACPAAFGQRTNSNKEIIPQRNYQPLKAADSVALRSILDSAISDALKNSTTAIYKDTELSAALIDLSDPSRIVRADHNGELRLYPASVVKLFYLAALERQTEDDKVTITPELTRGVHDMIVDSSNEATQYILDVLTGTSSGAELPPKEFDLWQYKRNRVNRYFTAMGYTEINVNQKTFCEDAYGIEQQSRNYKGENRNML